MTKFKQGDLVKKKWHSAFGNTVTYGLILGEYYPQRFKWDRKDCVTVYQVLWNDTSRGIMNHQEQELIYVQGTD